ncbi:MAG: hypothetical protein OI74_11785 [Gammaproteobacteria bacterium (ex Lamellibrachia satsuma)]|nr:MAG: acyltransferase [Gammaproteobacteria bacterium (ex Lamellibrachia satsuma)]RRS32259.1 MAG: hypothetical protein OI74_11785 [Gammaproteobacteria bacterium (ex Lamellibrachia satsuma)]RRS33895.1 MAG: hypothetical protein NV67_15055 [Gammaproteobacteria bacterium (ex Lamellibrachia satsuma)]
MRRIREIEGLRAFLALWVLISHVLGAAGYTSEIVEGLPQLLILGNYAVDIFIIISGFVIFLLIDQVRGNYSAYITQRFFRLYPLLFVLFLSAVVLAPLAMQNVTQSGAYHTEKYIENLTYKLATHNDWLGFNILTHLTMLHGMVPEKWVPFVPGAFLDPAWSISLEWQFYLVAPLLFSLAATRGRFARLGVIVACLATYIMARKILPRVEYGAFLPFHIEFFFFGACSYFIYRHLHNSVIKPDFLFPTAVAAVFMIYFTAGHDFRLFPIALWLVFFALMLEPKESLSHRLIAPLFLNRISLWMGKVSYSIYLLHTLVITLISSVLLSYFDLARGDYFSILFVSTLILTMIFSWLTYRYIEKPGIILGKKLSSRFDKERSK